MPETQTEIAPGWYAVPDMPGKEAWWDGTAWDPSTLRSKDDGSVRDLSTAGVSDPSHSVGQGPSTVAVETTRIARASHNGTPSASDSDVSVRTAASHTQLLQETAALEGSVRFGAAAHRYNTVVEVQWKGGWPGMLSGESQAKAVSRCCLALNNSGRCVVATAVDRWSVFRRIGWSLLAVLTLGFVVRHENLILITAPMNAGPATDETKTPSKASGNQPNLA